MLGQAYVSLPAGADTQATKTGERWARALTARVPAGKEVLVIADMIDGKLTIRTAHMVTGEIGDFTEPTKKILGEP